MGLLCGRTGRLNTKNGDFRPGQYSDDITEGGVFSCECEPCLRRKQRQLGAGRGVDGWVQCASCAKWRRLPGADAAALAGDCMIQPLVELYGGCMVVLKVS